MYTTSTAYKTEIQKRVRSFECRVTIGDRVFTNNEVQSIDLNGGIQDVFSIGNTPSVCLELVLRNTTDTIFTTNSVKVEIGLKIGNTIEYVPLGIFNVEDIKKDDYTTKFTCYDNMTKFEIAYFSSLGDNPTLQQVVNELATKTGVQFTGTLPAYNVKKLEGFTCREVLGYVASLCGGNALITRDGNFTIVYPTDISRDVGEGVFDLQRDEVKYKVGKITCQIKEQETISKGSLGIDNMELSFENPWVTETILTDIYNRLNGFNYLGYTMKWQGDLSLDIGDIITYTDVKGVTRKLPILYRKLSYDGGLDSELSAKGETKNKNSFNSSGAIGKKVERVVTELAIVNKAFIDYANINDANIKNLQVETAKIHNLEVETANINNILAGNIGSGSIQTIHLTGKNVVIDNAVIKSAMIDSLDLSKLNAGTISTNKFTIASTDGAISLAGTTMQFKDKNNKVRIQMGKDTAGNFNFIVRAEDGTTTLIDGYGVKEKAIADNLIVERMIGENAVGEKQINYSSLITGINKDDNTSLIKASKVAIDLEGQSLEVAFSNLKSNVDNIEIGGRNLLRNTALEKDTSYFNLASGVTRDTTVKCFGTNTFKYDVTGLTANAWRCADSAKVNVIEGDKYSVSAYVNVANDSVNDTATFVLEIQWINSTGTRISTSAKGVDRNIRDKWQIVKCEGKTAPTGAVKANCRVYVQMNGKCWVGRLNFEKGTKCTDWTPALEDADQVTQSLQTQINANIKGIETLVKDTTIKQGNNTVKLQDFYSSFIQTKGEISQKVTQSEVDSSINKLELGGINLFVKKTATKNKYLNSSGVEVYETNWFYTDYINVEGIKNLIASGYVNLGLAPSTCYYDANKKFVKGINNNGQSLSKLITIDPGISYIRFSCDIRGFDTLKIEKGTKSTSWSPAPEDLESRFNSVEQKITATALTTTITEAINAGTNSLTTMQFVLDKNGTTIKNGALKILNTTGDTVFNVDTDGNALVKGNLETHQGSTWAIKTNRTVLLFNDWEGGIDKAIGSLYSSRKNGDATKPTLAWRHEGVSALSIAYRNNDSYYSYMDFDYSNILGDTKTDYPIRFKKGIDMRSAVMGMQFSYSRMYETGANRTLVADVYTGQRNMGGWGLVDGSSGRWILCAQPGNVGVPFFQFNDTVKFNYAVTANSLVVTGSKQRIIETDEYGTLGFNAYETATPYFGDIGRGKTNKEGICIIHIDELFKMGANTDIEYEVFLQKRGKGDIWIKESNPLYFIVEGTPNLEFSWEIKAIQRNYEEFRYYGKDREVNRNEIDWEMAEANKRKVSRDNLVTSIKNIEEINKNKYEKVKEDIRNEVII
ncbi:hypothetical protein [Clostridium sp.]|uniref:hypothetical protein n=1 Tax=Clostridium sp. TaxID=1506 RepID=UPI002913AD43|nr:hypothetical protein [Clostridium sp.]MDU7213022.1 hypothetical protein [Clostridium sp.]